MGLTIANAETELAALWPPVRALYEAALPAWEREPSEQLRRRIETRQYRMWVARAGGRLVGLSVVEAMPGREFGVLVYLATAEAERGKGIGGALCRHVVAWFKRELPSACKWLLVEADPSPAVFYERHGFRRLRVAYRAPHFRDSGETPMALMAVARVPVDDMPGETLRRFVRATFVHGYGLSPTDDRIKRLCAEVPFAVALGDGTA